MKKINLPELSQDKFKFVHRDEKLNDSKFDTKPVGYLKDAMTRFKKNKSSVAGAIIILCLVVFAIVSPIISVYELGQRDSYYMNKLPVNPLTAPMGIWDGAQKETLSEVNYHFYRAIGEEIGKEPIVKLKKSYIDERKIGNSVKKYKLYDVILDSYLSVGVVNMNLTVEQYAAVQAYQNETGKQVIYPAVDREKTKGFEKSQVGGNYWYEVNEKGVAVLTPSGDFKKAYKTGTGNDNYDSIRIDGDPGNYSYAVPNQSGYSCRIDYYEYYVYQNGFVPQYLFGTNTYGQDIFCALGSGARFSIFLAVIVSVINLILGIIYGSIEGYYGGKVDMVMERISDVLSGVPFIVVVTLFQLHLAKTVGVVPSFLFAFVVTGWIGTAALVRKQFYRFKSQEYILVARTLGASDKRLMFKHIFPNSLGTIITSSALIIPNVIYQETMLTYLGIINLNGLNNTSVGVLLSQGQESMTMNPHVLLFPAVFISLMLISFNLFGNGLRDAFNPSLRGVED